MADYDPDKHCGAKKRQGEGVCTRPKGWGTNHSGRGRCKLHGGTLPSHVRAAEREAAEEAVVTLGLPREIDPHQALLDEVHRAAGHVAWLELQVRELAPEQVVHGITKTTQLPDGSRRVEAASVVSTWVKLYQEERDRLRRVCADAIRCGVEERQVRIQEEQAAQVAAVLRHVLTDLGHDPTNPEVRRIVRMRLIDGGQQ